MTVPSLICSGIFEAGFDKYVFKVKTRVFQAREASNFQSMGNLISHTLIPFYNIHVDFNVCDKV